MSHFYIKRRIRLGDELLTEAELLRRRGPIVVLAEPGAGKSDLLAHLAILLGVDRIRANRFRFTSYMPVSGALVVDAMDEVARINEGALDAIVEKAAAHYVDIAVFSSRSGEWERSRTKHMEDCFGAEPTIVYLDAFDANEQRALFSHVFPSEDFDDFAREAVRCDLHQLLSNPQFLQLLGHGYIENNRRFDSKQQTYADAARKLTQESDGDRWVRGRPETDVLVRQAGSVFARLLLSGASGVSRVEKIDDRDYPYIRTVEGEVDGGLDYLLDSKLFKPAGDANEHEPVHRIMAEYLAARYLIVRLMDAGSGFSLKRCLAIIAPNGVVRDELRGMLGWMAALGGDLLQRAMIDLDPYAVLSNGDPAQLLTRNKILLLERLQDVSKRDPYFRRGDYWRSFNVAKFFGHDVIDALRPILTTKSQIDLRLLVFDLLEANEIVKFLTKEIEEIFLSQNADKYSRLAASRLLLREPAYDLGTHFETLLQEGSFTSLQILAEFAQGKRGSAIGRDRLLLLLNGFVQLYLVRRRRRYDETSRHFIKSFLRNLEFADIPSLLDALTAKISCECDPRHEYRCECRNGVSKVVGGLLDRHFALTTPDAHDPTRVWSWIKDLRFTRHISRDNSTSVAVLQDEHALRRGIQRAAFSGENSEEMALRIDRLFYSSRTHSGILFTADDIDVVVANAFGKNNVLLWDELWRPHSYYGESCGPNQQRTTMRAQANEKPMFMRVWAKRDRASKFHWRRNRESWHSGRKRRKRLEAEREAARLESIRVHRIAIEAGEHRGWLEAIAHKYLYKPDDLPHLIGDLEIAHNALRNCVPFLEPDIPTIDTLAECFWDSVAMVLHAHCLLHFRENGSLENVAKNVLAAVKTEAASISGMADGEAKAFEVELDRRLFGNSAELEDFARRYVEPGLTREPKEATNAEWFGSKRVFEGLRETLPLEWLWRFPDMPFQAQNTLFRIASRYAPREKLTALIADRLANNLAPIADKSDQQEEVLQQKKNCRLFWLLNAFFFLEEPEAWRVLQGDRNNLLSIAARLDRFGGDEDKGAPALSPAKNYMVLDAFVAAWPPVDLPSGSGSDSPKEETAYRFLREIPGRIANGPPDEALPILDRLIADDRFEAYRQDLVGSRATAARKHALQHFRPPSPAEISALLEKYCPASVEDMRALVVDMLEQVEIIIRNSETDALAPFYPGGVRVDENTARNRLVDHLRSYLRAANMSDAIEFHMAQGNRCDITATAMINRRRHLLTIEVKGQWHSELFVAASEQLDKRYASNVDAEQQGIYLILWFGPEVDVAGRRNTAYAGPKQLKDAVIAEMSLELRRRIDVVVIDLSRQASQAHFPALAPSRKKL
ncbi:hypothetical protein RNI52_00295 [Labrys neptuniae]|uniref:hypothetical protein n=1 Tax=Labrys neptuniae TaxID=376174 RepID=UPI00288CDD40|nr:hypothetical protein [Labrys neptuniae]MDT3375749.1 hypothetical protein [Labrys neptuniae]